MPPTHMAIVVATYPPIYLSAQLVSHPQRTASSAVCGRTVALHECDAWAALLWPNVEVICAGDCPRGGVGEGV